MRRSLTDVLSAGRDIDWASHLQKIGQVEPNRARDLTKARRIWCGFVDAGDAKLTRACAGRVCRQANHAAHCQVFGLGELTGDEDVSVSGFLCRPQGPATSQQSEDG